MAGFAETVAELEIEDFRQALRRLAGGVTVVACRAADGTPRGIVMTAVMSLSFDPPSMLIAVNAKATLLPALTESGRFSINMIDGRHDRWCRDFVAATPAERFNPRDWTDDPAAPPTLRHAAASILCDVDQAEPFGSHLVIRGLVRQASFQPEGQGLIYLDGHYARAEYCPS